MEKAVVFGPIIIFFLIFGVIVILFLGFIFKLIKKSKESYWVGEVKDKVHNQKRDFDTNRMEDFYYLVVKCDDGKEMKVGISPQFFEAFNIGDRIEKPKGELYPRKL